MMNENPCEGCIEEVEEIVQKYYNWQPKEEAPKPITYTREEVLELMQYAASSRIDSVEPILENFDKIKNQKK